MPGSRMGRPNICDSKYTNATVYLVLKSVLDRQMTLVDKNLKMPQR